MAYGMMYDMGMYPGMMYPGMMTYPGTSTQKDTNAFTQNSTSSNSGLNPWQQSMINAQKAWRQVGFEGQVEQEKMNQEIAKRKLETEAKTATYAEELKLKQAEELRKMKAETDKQLAEARLAALNLQSVLRAGNMDLLEDAYNKYLNALVTIPEVREEFCNEDGSFVDINKQRSVAMTWYSELLTETAPDGKGGVVTVKASMLEDAGLLPGAFSQGVWNGATFGFFKKDHQGTALKLLTGQDISKEDKIASNACQTLGSAAVGATAGGVTFGLIDNGSNKKIETLLSQVVVSDDYAKAIDDANKLAGVTNGMTDEQIANQYAQTVATAENKVTSAQNELEKANKQVDNAQNNLDTEKPKLEAKKQAATEKINELEAKKTAAQNEIAKIDEKLKDDKLTPAERTKLNRQRGGHEGNIKNLNKQIGTQKGIITNSDNQIKTLETNVKKATENSTKAADALEEATEKLDDIKTKIAKASEARANLSTATKRANAATKKLQGKFGKELADKAVAGVKGGGSVSKCSESLKAAKKFKIGGKWGALACGVACATVAIWKWATE